MSKTALVTGATSGIGMAIADMLIQDGWQVYGVGRDITKCTLCEERFHPIACDLLNDKERSAALAGVPKEIDLLVNNAGAAYYGMHEEINENKIVEMVKIDLEMPMILCAQYMRGLRKCHGTIVNICSVTALGPSTHAAVYGACKAGLLHFSRTLFAENRKFGVNVAAILPDMTVTDLYRNADFEADEATGCSLDPEDVADAVRYVLQSKEGVCVNEIVLRPQLHRIQRKCGK